MTNNERFYTFPSVSHEVGWLFLPVDGTAMHKVKIWGFYVLGTMIRPLTKIKAGVTYADIIETVQMARIGLGNLDASGFLPVSFCETEKADLSKYLHSLLMEGLNNPARQLDTLELQHLINQVKRLENVLESQLNDLKIYLVAQKEWYSTSTLVEAGEELIPSHVKEVISDYAKNEMRQAGRCIAFDLPSAAGFHIIRALENVVRSYYDLVTNGRPRPDNQSMGVLVKRIEELADPKKTPDPEKRITLSEKDEIILSVLNQIKNLHRNPYIHEVVLKMKEVTVFMGIAQSAIGAIGDALIEAKQKKDEIADIKDSTD